MHRLAVLRRILVRRALGVAVLLGLSMLRLVTSLGMRPTVATEVYLLAVSVVAVGWCLQVLAGLPAAGALWSRAERRPHLRVRPDRLEVLEELTGDWVRTSSSGDAGLRAAVRTLIQTRLRRLGIDLDHDPRAPALLGPTTWQLVRADQPGQADLDASTSGLTRRETDELVRTLTALGHVDFVRTAQIGESTDGARRGSHPRSANPRRGRARGDR